MTAAIVLALRLGALAALYGFLAFALWTMWRNLERAAELGRAGRVPMLRLALQQKRDKLPAGSFTQTEVIIGRGAQSDVRLKDRAVSVRHARFSFHDGHWWIDDLGSSNGTRLNREPVRKATVLTDGDEIKCGSTRLLVGLPNEDALYRERVESRDD